MCTSAVPRDAATIIVVRDTPAGIELYMLRRGADAPALPDAYVFPGGLIANTDRSPQARMRLVGRVRPTEPAFTYAAIRETFEEAGLLFTVEKVAPEALAAARAALLAKQRTFAQTLIDLNVQLDARAIHYFSRWITPPSIPHRFDARFFVARLPAGQEASADAGETYDGRWVTPAGALEMIAAKKMDVVFPTHKHIERLATFKNVASLLSFAQAKSTVPVTPDVRETDDGPAFFLTESIEATW